MMQQSDGFRLAQDADMQALELSYQGDPLSMLVLLPKAKDGILALVGDLSVAKIDALVGKLRKTEVDVAHTRNSSWKPVTVSSSRSRSWE